MQLEPGVVRRHTARAGGHRLPADLEATVDERVDEGLELLAGPRCVDRGAQSGQLVGTRGVEAAPGEEAVGAHLDVEPHARGGRGQRALVVLVGRLVRAEPHVAVRPVQAGGAELVLERVEEVLHRLPDGPGIPLGVGLPPRARVVGPEVLVEVERVGGDAGEGRHEATIARPPDAQVGDRDARDASALWRVGEAGWDGGRTRTESGMVDVELVEVPSETVARVRRRVPVQGMAEFFTHAFEQVMHVLPEAGGRVSGPPFGWYHGMPTDTVDVSAGFPVAGDVHVPDGGVVVEERPGGRAAVAVHVGPYDTIQDTYGQVMAWIGRAHPHAARGHVGGVPVRADG